jgi:hypothetical protein
MPSRSATSHPRKPAPGFWLVIITSAVCAWTSPGHAYGSLQERLGRDNTLVGLLPEEESHAVVQDGFLGGTAVERVRHLPDGRLRIDRLRHYTRMRHPETGAMAALPEAWEFEAHVTLLPSLRLVEADTSLRFRRSADTVFSDYKVSERDAWLFQWDRSVVRLTADGRQLEQQSYLNHKALGGVRYDYPTTAIPFEIVGPYLSVAARLQLDQFDFDLLLPGGSIHGVRSQIHRTRDLQPFAKDYHFPKQRLQARSTFAVVDMRLSSPIKYLFFPHHFFAVFSWPDASKLLMLWGGDPQHDVQAFRLD